MIIFMGIVKRNLTVNGIRCLKIMVLKM